VALKGEGVLTAYWAERKRLADPADLHHCMIKAAALGELLVMAKPAVHVTKTLSAKRNHV
jgi:hypothetical protein